MRTGTGSDGRPVALVLGAAVWAGGRASPTLRRRALRAVELWHAGQVSGIVACGGVGRHGPSEAEVICALCLEAGVPEAVLWREAASRNTEQNIRLARPVLEALGVREVLVVTDLYHLPRARLVARRQGLQASGAWPALRGARPGVFLKGALRELPAYVVYLLRGAGR